jgi:hypothetical protein
MRFVACAGGDILDTDPLDGQRRPGNELTLGGGVGDVGQRARASRSVAYRRSSLISS